MIEGPNRISELSPQTFLLYLGSYACLARRGVRSFRTSPVSAWLERAFGAALVFFGVRLLFSRK